MRLTTSRRALSAATRSAVSGSATLNRYCPASLICHSRSRVGLKDILVAGQHLLVARAGRPAIGRQAEQHLANLGDFRQHHAFDRPGRMEMQAGRRRRRPGAETQDDALLVGLDLVELRSKPRRRTSAPPAAPSPADRGSEASEKRETSPERRHPMLPLAVQAVLVPLRVPSIPPIAPAESGLALLSWRGSRFDKNTRVIKSQKACAAILDSPTSLCYTPDASTARTKPRRAFRWALSSVGRAADS